MNSTGPLDNPGTYAVVGAGPSGPAAARNLQRAGIPGAGHELASGVGGLWDIDGPRSRVLDYRRLRTVFGYNPGRTSREAFDEWRAARRSY